MPQEDLEYLEVLFEDLDLDNPTDGELDEMLAIFYNDFVDNVFQIKGCNVKVILQKSWHKDFRGLPETFVHLITRDNKYKNQREFDCERANRIHWVKEVLLNHTSPRVKYFEYADGKEIVKHHYWLEEKNFMVVLKPTQPDLMVVTAFCIDDFERARYRKRFNVYRDSLK